MLKDHLSPLLHLILYDDNKSSYQKLPRPIKTQERNSLLQEDRKAVIQDESEVLTKLLHEAT